MIKLKSLLIESGVLVKNKKTGNVYRVKKSNPEKHDYIPVGATFSGDVRKEFMKYLLRYVLSLTLILHIQLVQITAGQ